MRFTALAGILSQQGYLTSLRTDIISLSFEITLTNTHNDTHIRRYRTFVECCSSQEDCLADALAGMYAELCRLSDVLHEIGTVDG